MRRGWVAFVTFLMACGGEIAKEELPSTGDVPPAAPAERSGESSATESASTPTRPTAACEAVDMSSSPEGVLAVEKFRPPHAIDPVDVYAEQLTSEADGVLRLRIVLTETRHECGFRASRLSPRHIKELSMTIEHPLAEGVPFEPGKYAVDSMRFESGERCITEEELAERGGWSGPGMAGMSANGAVTITKRTASTVEGTFDVATVDGGVLKGTFVAPICESVPVAEKVACCPR